MVYASIVIYTSIVVNTSIMVYTSIVVYTTNYVTGYISHSCRCAFNGVFDGITGIFQDRTFITFVFV